MKLLYKDKRERKKRISKPKNPAAGVRVGHGDPWDAPPGPARRPRGAGCLLN